MPAIIVGGCLCGSCRYASKAEPIGVRACHCHRCQKATGAPFYARALIPRDAIEMSGPVGWFDSGTGVRRGYCTLCGTSLFTERPEANRIGMTMGSLDDPGRFDPTEHIWTSSKQRWLNIDDGRPQYPEEPPPAGELPS